MTTVKKAAKKKVAKRTPGNTKIYPVREILEKYNLTPQEFQDMAQANLKPTHMSTKGITSVGLMMIGKAVKKLGRSKEKAHKAELARIKDAESDCPKMRELEICAFKPPNHLRLWCIDWVKQENGPPVGQKVTVIVTKKVHEGSKPGAPLLCERIEEGIFRHPPLERDQ